VEVRIYNQQHEDKNKFLFLYKGYNNCNLKPCQNNGVCRSRNLVTGDYECDCSRTNFTGKSKKFH
jgi:hypothetical protein